MNLFFEGEGRRKGCSYLLGPSSIDSSWSTIGRFPHLDTVQLIGDHLAVPRDRRQLLKLPFHGAHDAVDVLVAGVVAPVGVLQLLQLLHPEKGGLGERGGA